MCIRDPETMSKVNFHNTYVVMVVFQSLITHKVIEEEEITVLAPYKLAVNCYLRHLRLTELWNVRVDGYLRRFSR